MPPTHQPRPPLPLAASLRGPLPSSRAAGTAAGDATTGGAAAGAVAEAGAPALRPHAPPAPHEPARERLAALGPEALSPEDLLALVLAPGAAGEARARERAHHLLERLGGLRRLCAAGIGELVAAGLPRTGAVRLAAALALGRRVRLERLSRGRTLRSSGEIFDAFHERLRDLRKERFLSVMLDGRNRVLREDLVSEGILTASLVHPREVFAPAIREGAGALLLVHNHPSGDPEPSPEDMEITRRLCAVGELVGIRILDHVVIGDGGYVSFLERGLLPS